MSEQLNATSGVAPWEAVRRSPEFAAMVRARRRFVVPALTVFGAYTVAFLLACGYAPGAMAARIASGFTTGMAVGLGYLLLVWVLTVAYLWLSDHRWESLARAVPRPAPVTPDASEPRR